MTKTEFGIVIATIFAFLLQIAIAGGVLYTAGHFVSKYW